MLKIAAAALSGFFIASASMAQEYYTAPSSLPSNRDQVDVREGEFSYAEVFYDNSGELTSTPMNETFTVRDIEVRVNISVTKDAEKIWVYPSAGFEAIPDYAEVEDGDNIVIEIHPLLF